MAWGEMSMPWMRGVGMVGWRREWRRRGMQPVPVQRSRMRSFGGWEGWERRVCARWEVRESVSGLGGLLVRWACCCVDENEVEVWGDGYCGPWD